MPRRRRLLGVGIDDLAFADAVALMRTALAGPDRCTLFFVNAHTLDLAAGRPEDQAVLDGADFVFGDGTGVRWAMRWRGVRLRGNLNGTDLLPALFAAAGTDGRSCFLLGDRPAVVAAAAAAIGRRFPGWRVVGQHHGFLDAASDAHVRAEIAAAKPDLLLVGMGNPLQERWIAAEGDLPVRLVVGVGALFGYMSGNHRRAPPALRRFGMEWLFVLIVQRHKWHRYLVGAPRFLFRVLSEGRETSRP